MSKFIKSLIQKQYEDKFANLESFVVVETKGVDGNENNKLRGALLEKGIRMTVVKNSLMRRTMETLGMPSAGDLFDSGPCTIVYGGDSVVDVAKEMVDWAKKLGPVNVRGAFVDGKTWDAEGALALSKMPTRAELQGEILTLAQSPGRRVAGAIMGPGGIVAGCIKGLVEKLEGEAA